MMVNIPWNLIGPAATIAIAILLVVFGFILKMQKGSQSVPKSIDKTDKKSLCFEHHGDIASNKTAIEMIGTQMKENSDNNTSQHKDLFNKIDNLKITLVKEFRKSNGQK